MTKQTILTIAASAAISAPAFAESPFAGFREGYQDTLKTQENHVLAMGAVTDDLPPMLSKGTQELGVSGFLNWADDTAYNLNLTYGWFVRDRWEVGFGLGVQGVDDDVNVSLGLFTEYNFCFNPSSKWVPFIGASASWASLDTDAFDSDSIALGIDLGIKYFIRENIALSFSVGADYAFDDVFPGEDDFAKQLNIGTRFYF